MKNKLLHALEKQALDYAADELTDSGIGGIPRFNELFTTKFAELIIKECAEECTLAQDSTAIYAKFSQWEKV